MADANSTDLPTPEKFAVRLNEALAHWQRLNQRSLSALEKIQFIAQAAGRTNRTARAWLDGITYPTATRIFTSSPKRWGRTTCGCILGLGIARCRAS